MGKTLVKNNSVSGTNIVDKTRLCWIDIGFWTLSPGSLELPMQTELCFLLAVL